MISEIICVGTELLLGDITNTNAKFLSKELSELGINVYYQTVVGDNAQRIKSACDIAFSRSDIVITTGGLGPTKDDLTKEIIAEYFNRELIYNEDIYKDIENYFYSKYDNPEISSNNKKQAYIPRDAQILKNRIGTAPGIIIRSNEKIAIMLPGPPKEMETMFEDLKKNFLSKLSDQTIASTNIKIKGIGEAKVADMIDDLFDSENPTVAPYAKEEGVTLRVTASGKNKDEAMKIAKPMIDKIKNALGNYIVEIK